MTNALKSKIAKAGLGLVAAASLLIGAVSVSAYTFNTNLKYGMKGNADVAELQKALGVTPAVGNFGPLTLAAVKAYQTSHGLPSTGFVGALTRAALNAGGTTTTTGGTTVTTGAVTAGLSTDNPASVTLTAGSANSTVLKFDVANGTSAAVNVTSVKVTKYGNLGNTYVTGVSVVDGNGMRHGNVVTTLGADGQATLGLSADPITVPANSKVTLSIKVNLSSSAGVSFGMKIAAAGDIMLSTGTVSGTFPLMGNTMWVESSSSLGAVTLDEKPVNASGVTLNADATSQQEIAKFSVAETTSNEAVMLTGVKLYNNGNAAPTDYADVQLVDQTGTVVATAQPMGQYVTFAINPGYTIGKGQTKDFTVRAKLVAGASRTIQFVVYNDYDLTVVGAMTNVSILATAGSTDTSFPIGDTTSVYNKVTVGSGSLVFSRATDSSSTSVVPGATDVVLAKYTAKPVGEDMELRGFSFGLDQDTGSHALTGTVYVKVDGATVFSAAANTTNFPVNGTSSARSLSSYPILKAGVSSVVEVVASVSSSANSSDAYFVNDFDITSVKRLLTNDIMDPSVAVQDGFTRAVQAATLTTTTLSTPVATSIVPGTNGVALADFEFNATGSGEDVRVTAVTVTDTLGSGSDYSGLSNLVMKDDAGNVLTTTSSTSTNANTVAFTFTNAIVVSKTATTKIHLFGDLLASTGTSHTFKIASGNTTASGKDTGNTVTASVSGTGQTMTATTGGNLNIATLSGAGFTPNTAAVVSINATDGIYLAAKFNSLYEGQKITTFKLKATGTALVQNNIKNIRLYAQTGSGALLSTTTAFATASQFSTCSSNVCSYTWTSADNFLPMSINPGTPVTVFVKADIQGENVAKLGNDFYMSVTNDGTDVIAKGVTTATAPTYDSGTAGNSGAHLNINPFSVVVTGETPTNGSTNLTSMGAGTTLGRFKVMNNGSAQITLTHATFTDTGSHTGTDERYRVYASSENSNDYTANTLETSGSDTFAFGSLASTITINGGSYRYLTVTLSTVGSVAAGDSYSLSVASLGDLKFSVTEANLGYDATQNGDQADTISSLYVDGKPVLGSVQKQ